LECRFPSFDYNRRISRTEFARVQVPRIGQ
jgi:hypothetical protein